MVNKKAQFMVIGVMVILVVLAVVGFYFYNNSKSNITAASEGAKQGRMVFAITDATKDLNGVTNVYVTISGVQAHSIVSGWVTLSSSEEKYDLIALKQSGKLELVADSNVSAGMYDQVKLDVTKVVVVDAGGNHEAKLPSNELKINTDLNVNNDSTATAKFDFIADESIHVTGNGKYILAPVVQIETRENANVNKKSDNTIEIINGNVRSNDKIGMDINGNLGIGLGLGDKNLDIDQNGDVMINSSIQVNTGLGTINGSSGMSGGVSGGIGY